MIDQSEEDLPLELRERKNRMIEKGLLEVTAEFKAKVLEERATILKERMDLPEKDQHDPEYERLCYARYRPLIGSGRIHVSLMIIQSSVFQNG